MASPGGCRHKISRAREPAASTVTGSVGPIGSPGSPSQDFANAEVLASFPQRNFSRKRARQIFRKPNVSGAWEKASTVRKIRGQSDFRGLSVKGAQKKTCPGSRPFDSFWI